MVVPGNSANSFLLYRVTGTEFGMQMPPTGPLKPEQIDAIISYMRTVPVQAAAAPARRPGGGDGGGE